jgi:hypothetical protein
MSLDSQRFQQILSDARARTPSTGTDTMVVAAHLAQIRLFMVRQGVEWFAKQDTFGTRREFIKRVVDFNELLGRLDAIIDAWLIEGKGFLFFRPSRDLYRIHYFTIDQYRAYYDEENQLEEVQFIYSFRVRSQPGFGADFGMSAQQFDPRVYGQASNDQTRWVMMRVKADIIEQTITPTQPQFDQAWGSAQFANTKTYVNTLGFIPGVEVFNNRGVMPGTGHGEFDWLASHILEHDRMVKNIRKNLQFFGTPTLVSSRPRQDLLEPDNSTGDGSRATVSSNSGFIGLNRRSTRTSEPGMFGSDGSFRVPRVIANVEAADRVTYIMPDPVPGDLTGYAQQYQEMIRAALGGVDDLSISSGATAYEVRTLYGKVQATSKRKCRDLFEYGFCKLFSLMILHEEQIFRDSFSDAIGLQKPPPFLPETLPPQKQTPQIVQKFQGMYDKAVMNYQQDLAGAIEKAKEEGQLPPGVLGLLPDGDTRVNWRWQGEVFEDSKQEILQASIICRNLQELGVGSLDALAFLFPDKTPEERAAMLTGYPFRMVEATQRSMGVFMDIQRGLYQVPHPQEPDVPLAADPQLDLVPYLVRSLGFLQKELSYTGTHGNVDPASLPTNLSDADRVRAQLGEPTELERERERRRDAFRSAGLSGVGASNTGGVRTGQLPLTGNAGLGAGMVGPDGRRPPDTDAFVPGNGGTIAFDPAGPYTSASRELAGATAAASGLGPGFSISMGAPDLLAPTNAGLPTDGSFGGAGAAPDQPVRGGRPGAGRGRPRPTGRR